jgi:hypothetical protein
MQIVFAAAVWTETQGLGVDVLLLFPREKEALAGELCDGVDEADPMVDVVAVKEANVLVRNQDVLKADFADVWHFLDVAFVELVLECGQAFSLERYFSDLGLLLLYHEDQELLAVEI